MRPRWTAGRADARVPAAIPAAKTTIGPRGLMLLPCPTGPPLCLGRLHMSSLTQLVAAHDIALLLAWLDRGWGLELSAEETLQRAGDQIRWSYRFLDHPNGILDESSRLQSRESTAAALRGWRAGDLAACFQAVFHVAALEAWLIGDLSAARVAAQHACALQAARAALGHLRDRAFLSRVASTSTPALTAGLRSQLGENDDPHAWHNRPEALELRLLEALAATDGRAVPVPRWD